MHLSLQESKGKYYSQFKWIKLMPQLLILLPNYFYHSPNNKKSSNTGNSAKDKKTLFKIGSYMLVSLSVFKFPYNSGILRKTRAMLETESLKGRTGRRREWNPESQHSVAPLGWDKILGNSVSGTVKAPPHQDQASSSPDPGPEAAELSRGGWSGKYPQVQRGCPLL